jgi:hypothetical protein
MASNRAKHPAPARIRRNHPEAPEIETQSHRDHERRKPFRRKDLRRFRF